MYIYIKIGNLFNWKFIGYSTYDQPLYERMDQRATLKELIKR